MVDVIKTQLSSHWFFFSVFYFVFFVKTTSPVQILYLWFNMKYDLNYVLNQQVISLTSVVDASIITILGKQLGWQDDMVARHEQENTSPESCSWLESMHGYKAKTESWSPGCWNRTRGNKTKHKPPCLTNGGPFTFSCPPASIHWVPCPLDPILDQLAIL